MIALFGARHGLIQGYFCFYLGLLHQTIHWARTVGYWACYVSYKSKLPSGGMLARGLCRGEMYTVYVRTIINI